MKRVSDGFHHCCGPGNCFSVCPPIAGPHHLGQDHTGGHHWRGLWYLIKQNFYLNVKRENHSSVCYYYSISEMGR